MYEGKKVSYYKLNFSSILKYNEVIVFKLVIDLSELGGDLGLELGVGILRIHRIQSTILLSRTFLLLCIPMIQRIIGHLSSCLIRQLSSRYRGVLIFCRKPSHLCRAS